MRSRPVCNLPVIIFGHTLNIITLTQGWKVRLSYAVRERLRLAGLVVCGFIIGLTLHSGFAARYSLADFGERRRQSIGTLTDFSNEGVYWYIFGMLLLFATYALGYFILQHAKVTRVRIGLIAIAGVLFCLLLLPMYPVDASDIYDYIMRGRMSATYGLNPLQDVPERVGFDMFYRFASWHRTPSAYGPAWELMAHGLSALSADSSRNTQVIVYKLLNVAGYAVTAFFIGLTLQRIAPRRVLLGLYIFMWNPLVLYMTAGTGHNDAVMTAPVAIAIYCLSQKWFVVATFAATVGVLIKFIPALLVPIIVLVALRELGFRRWLRYAIFSAILCGGLTALLYAPYWHGIDTLRTSRRAIMYTGSVAAVARQWLMPYLDGVTNLSTSAQIARNTSHFLANGTLLAFAIFYLWQLLAFWRKHDTITALRIFARIITFYLLVVSLWFHAWYVIWLVAVVALLEDTPIRRLALVFSYLVTWQAFFYNYMSVETRSGEWLPWLDLVPVTIYMGYAWLFVGWYQLRNWRFRSNSPDSEIGKQLQTAREQAALSLSELSDELTICYDHLVQYERGTRPLNLQHARQLAQRLNLSLTDWLEVKA